MQNSHITLTCAALVNHNSLRKDEHGVEANGVTWHCTALMHERTAQKSAKTRNICISAPSELRSSTFLQQKVSFC